MINVNATEVYETLREVVTLKTLWADYYRKPREARSKQRAAELRKREDILLAKCQRHIQEYQKIAGGDGV
jgi:hypothetical protein